MATAIPPTISHRHGVHHPPPQSPVQQVVGQGIGPAVGKIRMVVNDQSGGGMFIHVPPQGRDRQGAHAVQHDEIRRNMLNPLLQIRHES